MPLDLCVPHELPDEPRVRAGVRDALGRETVRRGAGHERHERARQRERKAAAPRAVHGANRLFPQVSIAGSGLHVGARQVAAPKQPAPPHV